jgi:class 3 adenylate cyclase
MAAHTSTFRFTGKASHPKNALALVFDLEGFSTFFNQPDVQDYVPAFLNHVSEAMAICLFSGEPYWRETQNPYKALSLRVVHEKFIGDGALYIILPPPGDSDFKVGSLRALCNRLWNVKDGFGEVVRQCLEKVRVVDIPRRIRFGLSRGSVFELRQTTTKAREYIGFPINLASRLQNYCPSLGFIASARLMIPDSELEKWEYRKVVATKIKGFPTS